MGQAKLRGSRDARVFKAKQKIESMKPGHIVCNNCQAELTEIITLDTRGVKDIEAAFSAYCTVCNHNTLAIQGDPDAVTDLMMAIEHETGSEVKTGIVPTSGTSR